MAPCLPDDDICFSCGRVITGSRGMGSRSKKDFDTSATYGRAQKGLAPTMRMAELSKRRKKKGKTKNLALVGVIACVFMFTPAQELLFGQFENVEELISEAISPVHHYPVETTYTVQRTVSLTNLDSGTRSFEYSISIPQDRTTRGYQTGLYTTQNVPESADYIQQFTSISIITDTQVYELPVSVINNQTDLRPRNEAVSISTDGVISKIFWPGKGSTDLDKCPYGTCLKWTGSINSNVESKLVVQYDITSTSYSWWGHDKVDSSVQGKSSGLTVETSGTFNDVKTRAGGQYWNTFGNNARWFDRGNGNYAVDGTNSAVKSAAAEIEAGLPATASDNVYAYARGSFEYIRNHITYARGLATPRSGPSCLSAGIGDCDEQSNLLMSLLRVKQIPSWYEFGALTGHNFNSWEAHGWSNIMLPFSQEWCTEKGYDTNSCYIVASVDVTNNMWLLKPTTAVSTWIEQPGSGQEPIENFFYRMYYNAQLMMWEETWETIGTPMSKGGTFTVREMTEEF